MLEGIVYCVCLFVRQALSGYVRRRSLAPHVFRIYTPFLYIGTQPDPPTHQPNQQPPQPQKKTKQQQACGDVVRNINCTPAPFARPEYKYAVEYSKIFAELFKPQVWDGMGWDGIGGVSCWPGLAGLVCWLCYMCGVRADRTVPCATFCVLWVLFKPQVWPSRASKASLLGVCGCCVAIARSTPVCSPLPPHSTK